MTYYLHGEFYGLGITADFPLKRLNIPRGLNGSGLWAFGYCRPGKTNYLKDAEGCDKPFYIDKPRLMVAGGSLMIEHSAIPVGSYGTDYPIYGNATVRLEGPHENEEDVPELNWVNPSSQIIVCRGTNIVGPRDHYGCPYFAHQRVIQPGWYRLEAYTGAGSSVKDVDGLGKITPAWQEQELQFWVTIW